MKKLLSVTLALALLGGSATAAMAHGRYGPPVHRGHYAQPYGYGYGYGYRRHDNTAAALGVGLLAFGLIATLAAQNNARYYAPPPGYYGPPPPPPAPYGYGYGY